MLDKIKKLDWSIVLMLTLMTVISGFLVHSADVDDPSIYIDMKKSLIIYVIGFLVFFGVSVMDYRIFLKISWYAYAFGFLLLVAVLFAPELNGAKGWFQLPMGFLFQPAELMKILIIVSISVLLVKREGEPLRLLGDAAPIGLVVFLPFALVMMQPDLGNAVIFVVILFAMFWIGNIKYAHVLIGLVLIVGSFYGASYMYKHYHPQIQQYATDHGKSHWVWRIDTFLDPSSVPADKSYQFERSKVAIGSGSLMGDGYMKGQSVHSRRIPYAYSDAIFVVVGEEFGFVGGSALLLMYFILIYRMILIAIQSNEAGGSYLIVGIVAMYVFHIFQNIGMFIGLMPVTGITLPFISYGGTSLLINMVAMGMVMSVRLHQEQPSPYVE